MKNDNPEQSADCGQIRNRIKSHRKVRAGDLVPHEWNFRAHGDAHGAALAGIYQEVGFARSLLAYELPDGRLKFIDGHLCRDLDPEMEVEVEVLDVNEEEARKLLLTIDPLASLALQQEQIHQRLLDITPATNTDLQAAWQMIADAILQTPHKEPEPRAQTIAEQYMILVNCRDEKEQVELLGQLKEERSARRWSRP